MGKRKIIENESELAIPDAEDTAPGVPPDVAPEGDDIPEPDVPLDPGPPS